MLCFRGKVFQAKRIHNLESLPSMKIPVEVNGGFRTVELLARPPCILFQDSVYSYCLSHRGF